MSKKTDPSLSLVNTDEFALDLERIRGYSHVLMQLAIHDVVPDDMRQQVQLSLVHAIESAVGEAERRLEGARRPEPNSNQQPARKRASSRSATASSQTAPAEAQYQPPAAA